MKNLLCIKSTIFRLAIFFGMLLLTSPLLSQNKKVEVRFDSITVDCNTDKLYASIQAKSGESISYDGASWSIRFIINRDMLTNPQIVETYATTGHESLVEQLAFTGDTIISYGVLELSPTVHLDPNNWESMGRLSFDILDYQSINPNNIDFQFLLTNHPIPSTMQEYVSTFYQPSLLFETAFNNTTDISNECPGLAVRVGLAAVTVQGQNYMSDDLRLAGLLPLTDPYGYSETLAPQVFLNQANEGNNIMDLVEVVLKNKNDPNLTEASQPALLQRDGDVVGLDGREKIQFSVNADDYYIEIRHRNHLSIMTATPFYIAGTNAVSVNFKSGQTPTYGTDAQVLLADGTYALRHGDTNSDGVIDANDRNNTWIHRNQTGFLLQDVNMDGVIDSADRNITWGNRNKFSTVPQ